MSLDALIMFFGAFIALLPFLGFPASWDTVLLVAVGLALIVLGIIVRRRGKGIRPARESVDSFVENGVRSPHDES